MGVNTELLRQNEILKREIERLRAENKAWQNQHLVEQCNAQASHIEKLCAELAELKAARVEDGK